MTDVITVQAHRVPLVDEVTARRPERADVEAVLLMLARCSRASLYHRFHGFSDGAAYFATLVQDRPADQTMLAWYGSACVGAATLAASAGGIPDLAVLIEDAWQHQGIGTRLAELLADRALSTGVTTVHADVLNEDLFLLRALRRLGSLTMTIERGTVAIDIDLANQLCRSDGTTHPARFVDAAPGEHRVDPPGISELPLPRP
jgi:GNAT superfamily N-acetyltransferase